MRIAGGVLCLTLSLCVPAQADETQDRLNRLADEITRLGLAAAKGGIDNDFAGRQLDALMELDADLRFGSVMPDELSLRWQDYGALPLKAPGGRLVAVGLPRRFAGDVRAVLEDGREVEIYAEAFDDLPGRADIYVPEHPDGPNATGTLTVFFDGAGSLQLQIAPRLTIPDAVPRLMRVAMNDLVRALAKEGVQAEALVAQFRQDPTIIPEELGYAAAALYLWSEAGRGDPVFRFLRSGVLEGPIWDGLGGTRDKDELNRVFSVALQNSGVMDRLMTVQQERINRISYVLPEPRAPSLHLLANTDQGLVPPREAPPPETVEVDELASLLVEGRAREFNRQVILNSAKDAQKLYSVTAFEPVTMTSAALLGGVLTMADKYMAQEDYNYPVSMSIEGSTVPEGVLLADDERKVFPEIEIVAKGQPYEVKVFSDGVDAALAAVDIATSTMAIGKGLQALGKTAKILTDQQRLNAVRENLADISTGLATTVTKDVAELGEKRADQLQKGSFSVVRIPERTWKAKVDPSGGYQEYISVGYNGEVAWNVDDYHALACWKNTQEGIASVVTTKPEAFAGLFDRKDFAWSVQDPKISLSASPGIISPGQTSRVTAQTSGASSKQVAFQAPALGGLSDVGDADALYGAPDEIQNCRELVTVSASYPPDGARICHEPPTASVGIIVAEGDGLIQAPDTLTCRDGEVLGFKAAHAEGADVMCQLSGPGTLTMIGDNEGVLDCPIKPTRPSSITCYTGAAPGQCARVIPIKRIYPDYAVTAMVSADRRRPLNDNIEQFFDDCGIENMTQLGLDLLDGGSGEARELPMDSVHNNCFSNVSLQPVGGGISGIGGGGTPSAFEGTAEGRYVANWPLGEGRDVSVSDAHSYRHRPYDPGRGPGDRSVLVTSDIIASITFDGPERFVVTTSGETEATSERSAEDTPDPDGGFADWNVWRRIEVNTDTELNVKIETSGDALSLVQAVPTRLVDNVPVVLLSGFDQSLTSVMMVGNATAGGLIGGTSEWGTAILPGPRDESESLTYLILFNGRVTSGQRGDDTATAESRTSVDINIKPVD